MSRSYRIPYAVFTSAPSAHEDKKIAARGLRRRLKQWIHILTDPEDALAPHRLECPHNDSYTWERMGRPYLTDPHIPGPDDGWAYRRWSKLHRK